MNNPDYPSKFHAWLARHKILFETVAVVVFTLASIFVAYLQWRTAEKQADITRRQSQPNFIISTHRIMKEGESSYANEELHIQNFGGPARELNFSVAVWYQLTLSKNFVSITTNIPVNGYYPAYFITSDAVNGMLVRCAGDGNNEIASQLERQVRFLGHTNGYNVCLLDLHQYVKLNYYDLFDRPHTDYFYVEPVRGGKRMSSEDGEKWIEGFSTNFWSRGGIEFYNTTPNQIFERANALFAK